MKPKTNKRSRTPTTRDSTRVSPDVATFLPDLQLSQSGLTSTIGLAPGILQDFIAGRQEMRTAEIREKSNRFGENMVPMPTITKKPAVKKAPAKKPVAKKPVAKKAPAAKPVAKKTTKVAKPAPKTTKVVKAAKPAKPAAKPVAKKAPAKKVVAKKAPAKKVVAKKAPAKKPAAKKTTKPAKAAKKSAKASTIRVARTRHFSSMLEKPWPVSRITGFMRLWGMSQIEMAVFCGVSYDSVTSWSRGRRRLVRRSIAEHLEQAEDLAHDRSFPKLPANGRESPWSRLRTFCVEKRNCPFPPLEGHLSGTYPICVVETAPGTFRGGTASESVSLAKGKGSALEIGITLGKSTLTLHGKRERMGGTEVIALFADPKDPQFFNGRAGCITTGQDMVRVTLWPAKNLPLRIAARAH